MRRPRSLRSRFLLVALVAGLPVAVVIGGLSWVELRREHERVLRRVLGEAEGEAANLGTSFEQTGLLLEALATMDALRSPGSPGCRERLARLRDATTIYADLGVRAPDGTVRCAASAPTGSRPAREPLWLAQARKVGGFAVGEHEIEPTTGRHVITAGLPMRDDRGAIVAYVYAATDLRDLAAVAAKGALPRNATVVVFDRTGRTLARLPEHDAFVGRAVSPTLVEGEAASDHVVREARLADEEPSLLAIVHLPGPAGRALLRVAVGVPRSAVWASAWRAVAMLVGATLAALVIVFVLTLVVVEVLVGRGVRRVAAAARRVAAGDLDARAGDVGGAAELADLGQALDAMAISLGARQLELVQLSRRLVDAQESERRHLAHELHDEVGQALTGLSLTLDTLGPDPVRARARLATARDIVAELIRQVRMMSLDLRPAMLDDLGLGPTLRWHVERFAQQTGVTVDLEIAGPARRYSPAIETAGYRLVQEALTNVARHSGVRTARVVATMGASALELLVEDGGHGFEPGPPGRPTTTGGLVGMRERAMYLGGRIEISSSAGRGTRVLAWLPVDSKQA